MLKKILIPTALLGVLCLGGAGLSLATDYQAMTLTELDAMRGTMALAGSTERDAYRAARQSKIQALSPDERLTYKKDSGNGQGSRLRDGSGAGSMNRGTLAGSGGGLGNRRGGKR